MPIYDNLLFFVDKAVSMVKMIEVATCFVTSTIQNMSVTVDIINMHRLVKV